jgi:hypothetical protein
VLTDNGAIYTAKYRGGKVALEIELERLGVIFKHSSPNHPQTCGKVERFHQSLKKYLAKQKAAKTLAELQAQIERFVVYYNAERPHRSLGRRTPQQVYDAKVKAHPGIEVSGGHYRIRRDKVDDAGSVTVRYQSKLFHIGMGRRFKGQSVTLLIADEDIRVLDRKGNLLRQLTLDPTRNYQPQSQGWVSTMS